MILELGEFVIAFIFFFCLVSITINISKIAKHLGLLISDKSVLPPEIKRESRKNVLPPEIKCESCGHTLILDKKEQMAGECICCNCGATIKSKPTKSKMGGNND